MQITANNISTQAATAIRQMIIDGHLCDSQRINEVQLAEELGVSRTPLREGLGRLVAEHLVIVEPRRGFFVASLSIAEFQQLYDIRPLLDPAALQLAGLPSTRTLTQLSTLNEKLKQARNASSAIQLDNEWHLLLLQTCPNKVLIELIENMINRTQRYEHALFRETENVWTASIEHDQILAALGSGNLALACRHLKQNMQSGKRPILEWLSARQEMKP